MRVNNLGYEVYFYTGGAEHKSGQDTMVFIHGAALDHTVWILFSRYWAKAGYNVVAIDLPGHGLTGGDVLQSIEQNAEFVVGFLDQLQLAESVCLVGHSMGSLVALDAAARLPGMKRLAMLGTSVPMGVGDVLLDAARDNDHSSVDIISLFGHSFGSQLGSNPVAGISAQNLGERVLENAADGVMFADLNACREYQAGLDAAAKVNCPVGVIVGEHDQMTPPKGVKKVLEVFPQAREICIPDCGHMMMSEKPEATHKALVEVIEGPT